MLRLLLSTFEVLLSMSHCVSESARRGASEGQVVDLGDERSLVSEGRFACVASSKSNHVENTVVEEASNEAVASGWASGALRPPGIVFNGEEVAHDGEEELEDAVVWLAEAGAGGAELLHEIRE
jgi:hypothetical protein